MKEEIYLKMTYSSTEIENMGPPPLSQRIIDTAHDNNFSRYTVIIKIIDDD